MSTYFISDLHLDPQRPASSRAFVDLLGQIHPTDKLYILGDFVEYWLGDDDNEHQQESVFTSIATLNRSGTPVYFVYGNRDFLIRENYLQRFGMELLPDPAVIDLYGQRTLLMHGDLLCTDDSDYQNFRNMVRNPKWQSQFLAKPLQERRSIVTGLRQTSQQAMQKKLEHIMDVNQQTVEDIMRKYNAQRLIHGHTHRPGIHRFEIDKKECERIVLGDWYQDTSILQFNQTGYQLLSLDQMI
ncbi:MAG: UDP-2,3-diacylglucosamine diphosphatase [Gammaproteobacteria bacterium]|nr:UDP-2,3-diacylglucosamine diphosphatase [Gammaproteobacteria bacterium]